MASDDLNFESIAGSCEAMMIPNMPSIFSLRKTYYLSQHARVHILASAEASENFGTRIKAALSQAAQAHCNWMCN